MARDGFWRPRCALRRWRRRSNRRPPRRCRARRASSAARSGSPRPSKITPEQARQLFALVDELIKFSSDETGLPIKSQVKREIISRAAVESYLKEKFEEDQSARRMQRDEIVLKKFGLLDRDFALKPFLLALLKEQIEAYYDSKTKTVYMLDWVGIEEQKPVLAHELTHALQDQHSDLEKWNDQTPDDVSLNSARRHRPPGQGRDGHGARGRRRGPGHGRHDGLHAQADGQEPGEGSGGDGRSSSSR